MRVSIYVVIFLNLTNIYQLTQRKGREKKKINSSKHYSSSKSWRGEFPSPPLQTSKPNKEILSKSLPYPSLLFLFQPHSILE